MAISRVDDQEVMPAASTLSIDVPAPAGLLPNDWMLHLFGLLNSSATITEPAGLVDRGAASSGTTLNARIRSRIVGSSSSGSMLIGMDAPVGSAWTSAVANYPGIRYTRDFGKDNVWGTDADTLTEPIKYGTGKFIDLPQGAVMHLSWKDDPALLQNWLDDLPTLPANHPGFYLSPWHEPRDEVDAGQFSTATFRSWGETMVSIVNSHPNGYLIRGVGPILTRFDLDEKGANPADYGFTGMTFFGVDCYQSDTSINAYYDTTKMFGYVFNKVTTAFPGIKLMVPEYGLVKQPFDTTGSARASTLTTHVNYLKSRGDVLAVAYFNDTGSIPGVPFSSTSPEADAWRALQAAQTPTEPTQYHWASSLQVKMGGWVGAYRGVDLTSPVAGAAITAGASDTTTVTTPPVNVPANGWLIFGVATRHTPGALGSSVWSSNVGTDVRRAGLATNAGSADISMAVFDSNGPLAAGTGVTRTLTSTLTEGTSVVFAVALRPASSGDIQPVPGIPLF
jgi:hypothetical protein